LNSLTGQKRKFGSAFKNNHSREDKFNQSSAQSFKEKAGKEDLSYMNKMGGETKDYTGKDYDQ